MQKQQKLLRRSKIPRTVEVFSPRTTAANIQKNDSRLLTRIILKLTKPTIVKLKQQFKEKRDEIDFITFAKIMGRELVGWEPNIPNRRYQMIRCLYKLFNQIDYLNKGKLQWDEVINFVAQKPLNTANEKIAKNSLKTFTQVILPNKHHFQNSLMKVIYMNNIDKLVILEQNSDTVKFVDPNNGQIWNKHIKISPKKLIVNISSLRKTKGEYRKKQLQLISSVRVLDIIYIPGKYKVLLTSSSDKFIRAWRYHNGNFVLSNDFTDEQFLFQKQFPQDIYSMQWDALNQILFCGSGKGKLYYYNIQLDLKNEMDLDQKQSHNDMINTMIVVPKLHFVVTGGMDGKVLLWDIQTFKLKQVYTQHTRSISCLAYHPDLILVFSAGFDTNICVWNPYTSNLIFKIITHSTAITGMTILPNTNFLVSVSSQGIMKITQLNKFKTLNSIALSLDQQFHLKPQHMTIIPSKLRLCIVGRSIEMFDYDKTYNPMNCDDNITISCKYSLNKFQLYTISGNKLKVWNVFTGNTEIIHQHQQQITSFIIDKYQKCFIIGDIKGCISVYNMSNGYKLNTLHKAEENHHQSSIYMLTSIIIQDQWLVIAVNQQNNILIFKQIYSILTYVKTIKILPHTNIKSIIYLNQYKLICIATDTQGMFIYQIDSINKIEHIQFPEIISIQQIMKNVIQISFISGKIKFYYFPPTIKQSPIFQFQYQEDISIVQSVYSSNKNYICDEKWEVSCYNYNQLIKTIVEEKYTFENVKIQCLWKIKVSNEPIKQMIVIPEWELLIVCSEDKQVKLWNMINGKYVDSLKQNYHKNQPVILTKKNRKTILELQNKYQEYDPFYYQNINNVSNSDWNLFLTFRHKFEEEHKIYHSLLKQLNKQIEQETIQKQNMKKQPISLEKMEDTKNKSINLLMKSFHQNVLEKGLSQSKFDYKEIREPARSTFVESNFQKCHTNNGNNNKTNVFPQTLFRSKQSIQSFKSLHMTRQFPGKMHRNQKNAFKIHFQTRLDPCEKALHNRSIQRLSSTFLKGKMSAIQPPKIYLNSQQAIAVKKFNQAFEKTSPSMYKSGQIFKNIIVRKSASNCKLSKTLTRMINQ